MTDINIAVTIEPVADIVVTVEPVADITIGLESVQGIGIQSVAINDSGHLIVTLTNGATIDAGVTANPYPGLPKRVWNIGAQLLPFAISPVEAASVSANVASVSVSGSGFALGGAVMSAAFSATLKQWLCALPDFSGVNSADYEADLVTITTNIAGMLDNTGPGATLSYSSGTGLQMIVQPGNHVSTVDADYTETMPFLMIVTGDTGQLDVITPNGTFSNVTAVPAGSTAYGILELAASTGDHVLALGLSTNPANVGSLTVPGDATPLR